MIALSGVLPVVRLLESSTSVRLIQRSLSVVNKLAGLGMQRLLFLFFSFPSCSPSELKVFEFFFLVWFGCGGMIWLPAENPIVTMHLHGLGPILSLAPLALSTRVLSLGVLRAVMQYHTDSGGQGLVSVGVYTLHLPCRLSSFCENT